MTDNDSNHVDESRYYLWDGAKYRDVHDEVAALRAERDVMEARWKNQCEENRRWREEYERQRPVVEAAERQHDCMDDDTYDELVLATGYAVNAYRAASSEQEAPCESCDDTGLCSKHHIEASEKEPCKYTGKNPCFDCWPGHCG